MIGPRPDCMDCKHLDKENLGGITCAAFPDGIPDNILVEQKKHNQVFPGQVGVFIFEKEKS